MKKLLALLLTIALLATATSCKKNDKTELPEEPPEISITEDSPREDIIKHNQSIDPEKIDLVQLRGPKTGDTIVTMETSLGNIYMVLYPEYAPLAVENFTLHAENEYYKGATFKKVMENFYIESGAPADTPNMSAYIDDKGEPIGFQNEPTINLWHFRGALAMRNKGENMPDSNTSEFFIVQAKTINEDWFPKMKDIGYPEKVQKIYEQYGGIPGYDSKYTVFGQVYSGLDVVDAIGEAEVDSTYLPKEEIKIKKITISTYNEEKPVPPLKDRTGLRDIPKAKEKKESSKATSSVEESSATK